MAPGNVAIVRAASNLARYTGRYDDALRLGLQAVEQDPLSATAYGLLGSAYRVLDRFAEAEAAFRKSLELNPRWVISHTMLLYVVHPDGPADPQVVMASPGSAGDSRLSPDGHWLAYTDGSYRAVPERYLTDPMKTSNPEDYQTELNRPLVP